MTLAEVFSTTIAVIALALSALSIYLHLREKTPRLRVIPTIERRQFHVRLDSLSEVPTLIVRLVNPSELSIAVKAVTLRAKGIPPQRLSQFHIMGVKLYHASVDPMREMEFIVLGDDLATLLRAANAPSEVRAVVHAEDELGRIYKSRPFLLHIDALTSSQETVGTTA